MDDEPDNALVPVSEPSHLDPYEREYMKGEGTVLYRTKVVAGWKMNTALLALGGLIVFRAASIGLWGSVIFGLPLLAVFWLLFGVLRVTVSERAVIVRLGLLGPTIPMAAIESAHAMDYRWTAFGGLGSNPGPDGGRMYNVMGDGGRAVKIRWRDAKGRPKVTYVGTPDADAIVRAIHRGRKALPAAAEPKALPEG